MTTPSLCGSFLTDRRSLVAFTWTITTVLTFGAFVMALVMMVHVHTRYKRLEHYYEQQWEYNQQYYNNREGGEGEGEEHEEEREEQSSEDREIQYYLMLSAMSSKSMTFVALYTMTMAIGLSLYGSTAIVGFTSLRGDYIAPCFSSVAGSSKLKLGIFGGAIVFFANLLLVCAVFFGEVRVEDWQGNDREDKEPYEIERIATVLAVTCMFLSALYTIFAVLLFLYFSNEDAGGGLDDDNVVRGSKPLASITSDPRRENFITMGPS